MTASLRERWGADAARWEREQAVPREVFAACAALQASASLFEELGAVSASLGALVNVQRMVERAVERWGTRAQRERWCAPLARGELCAALAITEPGAGSDYEAIEATWADGRLRGQKSWVTGGMIADLFLVVAKRDGAAQACLVERGAPGLSIRPVRELLGLRAAHVAGVGFAGTPAESLGGPGFGLSLVAAHALLHGRLHVAWMACGILAAAFGHTLAHVRRRRAFGAPLAERGQVAQAVTRMDVDLRAARHLCRDAATAIADKDEHAGEHVLRAKYFATRAASEHAASAVRLQGAAGCHEPNDVARWFRDAKVFEVIEGASEVIEMALAASLRAGE